MSDTVKTTMLDNILNYFTKVKANIRPVVYEKATIGAGLTKTYNLASHVPDLNLYDPLSSRITVLVLDSDPGSATLNNYINSEASITVGITQAGVVTVVNTDINSHAVLIRIDHPAVKV